MAKPYKPVANVQQKLNYALRLTAILYIALIALLTYINLTFNSGPSIPIWLLQCGPLLLLLPGMLKRYHRSFSWLCFLLLLYFVKAVDGAFHPDANWTDAVFIGLCSVLFVTAMMAARWLPRAILQSSLEEPPQE
ncbi:DUF2069 domain-containing protein [Teredinibacter waterburyi]|jgi:Predicted membrane protein|uniref:DUF2069 domain-containing protein n=1 Tax=Teredinibacter waterburyi TaxID=1500538 RepID=UPI00165EE7CD|nr:DUF2069 domain-containing protein [Teredinibacter waterburyi]